MNERNVILSCQYEVMDYEWDDILAQIRRLVLSKKGDYCYVEAEFANSEDSGTQSTDSNIPQPAIPASLIDIISGLIQRCDPEERDWMYAKLKQVQQAGA